MQTMGNNTYSRINQYKTKEVKCSNLIAFLVGFSGLLIIFAWDNCFNLMVLFPVIGFIFVWFLVKSNFTIPINTQSMIVLFIIVIYLIGDIWSMIISPNIIGNITFIRLIYSIVILFFYFVVTTISYNQKQIKIVLWGNVCSGVFIAILIFLSFLNGVKGKIAFNTVFGGTIEENYTAAILSFELVLAFILGVFNIKIYKKFFLFISAGIMFFSLCLTGSRAALIASVIALALFLTFYICSLKIRPVKKVIPIIIILLAVFFFFNYAEQILPPFLYNRMFGNLIDGLDDSSNAQRIALWENALNGFFKRPLFGYGIGNFNYYVRQLWPKHTVVVAHNTYLDFLVDSGIFGLSSILIMLFINIKPIFSHKGICFLPCLISLLITSFIVGGERTYFFWNGFIVLSIISKAIKQGENFQIYFEL
jgi:O-antigen ligase